MTRIFTDGAEFGDVLFWTAPNSVIASTTQKRSGSYSYRIINTNGRKDITGISELYFRCGFYASSTILTVKPVDFRNSTTSLCNIYYDTGTTNKIMAQVNSSTVATSTNTAPLDTWNLLEVHLILSDSGTFQVKLNGILEINYSGDTKPGSATTFDNLYFNCGNFNFYIDDLALNDTAGTIDNSWCGDGRIIILTPSGSGITNSWLNSGSVSGSANYLYVDDFPSDSDTTYAYASGSSSGNQDQYALSDWTGDTNVVISRIYPECRAKLSTSASSSIKLGYLPSGGSDQMSGSIAVTTNYSQILGTSASANPVTGLAWTISDLNALEYVIEVT